MSWLIPRLSTQQAQHRLAELQQHLDNGASPLDFVAPSLTIAAANPNGGRVAPPGLIQEWRDGVMARLAGFDQASASQRSRIDAETARAICEVIDPIQGDAAHDGVWAFLHLAVFPDLLVWRWGPGAEGGLPASRWIGRFAAEGARDRMHLKSLWRRWQVLDELMLRDPILGEDELVQLFERTAVARNPRLVRLCAQEILAHEGSTRMDFTRGFMKQVSYATGVRLLDVMRDEQLSRLVHELADRARPAVSPTVPVAASQTGGPAVASVPHVPKPDNPPGAPTSVGLSATPVPAPATNSLAAFDWNALLIPVDLPGAAAHRSGSVGAAVPTANATTAPDEWLPNEVSEVLAVLAETAPRQAMVLEFALAHEGRVSREELYDLCDFPPDRQLKGFRRPVTRASADLAQQGVIRDGLPELLTPWYEAGSIASGYRLAPIATPPTG